MRWKIIAVNAGIVVVIGLLTYLLMWTSLAGVLSDPGGRKKDVSRAVRSADAQLALDAFRLERWLSGRASSGVVSGVFAKGTANARAESATAQANEVAKAAVEDPSFAKIAPSLVLLVDAQGIALGRNGSNLMRGENIAAAYPSLSETLRTGATRSDLWLNRSRGEQMFVSYAPVRGDDGGIVGALVLGTLLNDERLARVAELTSGGVLLIGVLEDDSLQIVAKSGGSPPVIEAARRRQVVEAAKAAVTTGNAVGGETQLAEHFLGVIPLTGFGNDKRAVVISAAPSSLVPSLSGVLWPVLAVLVLGLVLVTIAGYLLGNYWARPIEDIEEGLLLIMNGQTDMRFDIEHPELGGLVFRINSLLNTLTGTPEDTTDEQGRPSRPPSALDYQAALGVASLLPVDPVYAARLASEPEAEYHARVYHEYIAAKQRLGEDVTHITRQVFVERLAASEAETREKQGRPVRYKVELRGNSVVLIAIPLPG